MRVLKSSDKILQTNTGNPWSICLHLSVYKFFREKIETLLCLLRHYRLSIIGEQCHLIDKEFKLDIAGI